MIGPHEVRVELRGERDQWGDLPVLDTFDLEGCYMIPRTASEADTLEATATIGYMLYADRGTRAEEIRSTSRVRWDGVWYEVDGVPGKYDWPDGTGAALAVPLKEVQ